VDSAKNKTLGLLIGDSHADAAYRGLSRHAVSNDAVLATMSSGGCAAIFGVHINNPDLAMQRNCERGRANALAMVGDNIKPKFAVLFSSWTLYGGREAYSLSEPGTITPFPDTRAGFIHKLKGTYEYLRAQGVERILVVAPVPIFRALAPPCVMRSDRYGISRDIHCSVTRAYADQGRKDVVSWLQASMDGENDIKYVDPIGSFCDEKRCRSYGEEGVLFYDSNHIGDAGLERIYQSNQAVFDWLFGV
jgi:hypothetical protein